MNNWDASNPSNILELRATCNEHEFELHFNTTTTPNRTHTNFRLNQLSLTQTILNQRRWHENNLFLGAEFELIFFLVSNVDERFSSHRIRPHSTNPTKTISKFNYCVHKQQSLYIWAKAKVWVAFIDGLFMRQHPKLLVYSLDIAVVWVMWIWNMHKSNSNWVE